MLDALLTRCDGLRDAHFVWYMADEGQTLLASLIHGRKVRLARDQGLSLDEVHVLPLERVDGSSSLCGSSDRDGTGEAGALSIWQVTIQHGTRYDHPRTHDLAFYNLIAPGRQHRNVSAHIAYARDTIGYQQGQDNVPAARKPVSKSAMHMHIPQAWNEKVAFAVDDTRVGRNLKMCRAGDSGDVVSAHDHCSDSLNRGFGRVDYGHIQNDQRWRGRSALRRSHGC